MAFNDNIAAQKSNGCAVFLAVLQLAMAQTGERLWLLEGGLAPNHRKHSAVSVHSGRNCSPSYRSSNRTLLTRLIQEARTHRPRMGSHGVWLCFCFVSSKGVEDLEQSLGLEQEVWFGFGSGQWMEMSLSEDQRWNWSQCALVFCLVFENRNVPRLWSVRGLTSLIPVALYSTLVVWQSLLCAFRQFVFLISCMSIYTHFYSWTDEKATIKGMGTTGGMSNTS